MIDLTLTRDPEVLIDLKEWEFDDDFKGALDELIKEKLAERVRVLFGENGIKSTLWFWPQGSRPGDAADTIEVSLSIHEDDVFAEATIDLAELLADGVDGLVNDPEACAGFAKRLHALAKKIAAYAKSGADGEFRP